MRKVPELKNPRWCHDPLHDPDPKPFGTQTHPKGKATLKPVPRTVDEDHGENENPRTATAYIS